MEFEKIKPRRVYEDVLSQITSLMVMGKINPGDRLMGEREMANELGVSRTTLREALRTLELLGLVEIKPGEGTFIKDHNVNQIIAPLALALSVEQNSLNELWETRLALEVEAAGLAAYRALPENLNYIERALKKMQEMLPDYTYYGKLDMRFHYMVAQASQNTMITRVLQTFTVHISEIIQKTAPVRFFHDRDGMQTIREHAQIFEAIKAHDVKSARRFMKEHLEGSMSELMQPNNLPD